MAMNSINDAAKVIQENMEVIRVRLAELDNLTQLTECATEIKSNTASLEENSAALNLNIENEFTTINALAQENKEMIRAQLVELNNLTQLTECTTEIKSTVASLEENSSALNITLEKKFATLNALAETSKQNLQDILKLLRLIGQLLNNPAYVKDLEKINSSFAKISEWLETLQDNETLSQEDLSTLKKIALKIK